METWEIKNDLSGKYLIVPGINKDLDHYSLKMLLNNTIQGVLPIKNRIIDDCSEYCFEVGVRKSIYEYFERTTLNVDQIKLLMKSILNTISEIREYLLCEDDLVLRPEYMYLEANKYQAFVCYKIGYDTDIKSQMTDFMEYLMNKLDYKDEDAVVLVYNLYKKSREEYVLEDLLDILNKDEEVHYEIEPKYELLNEVEELKEARKMNESLIIPHLKINDIFIILFGIVIFLLAIKLGIANNSMGTGISLYKVLLILLVIAIVVVFIIIKMPKEKILVNVSEDKTELLVAECDKTIMLTRKKESYYLEPLDSNLYKSIDVVEFPYFIGKLKTKVNYVLDYGTISRFHAKLDENNGRYYLTDLGSTNGTYINGEKVLEHTPTEVKINDFIEFATIGFYFRKC